MEPNLVVRLFFRNGGSVNYIHRAAEARQFLEYWKNNTNSLFGTTVDGVSWAAKTEDVMAIDVLPLSHVQQQAQVGPGRMRPGASGIN